ncbi:MAG TPA: hypothetical protein PKM88_16425, partial [bacterium]|nr:hypothetical protein [bacterium]
VERDADFAPQVYYAARFTISAADMQALLTAPLWWAVRTDDEHGGDEVLSPPVGWQKLSGLGQSQTWINQLEDKGVVLGVAPTTDQPHFIIVREKQRTGLGWSWRRILVADPPTRTIWYYYTVQAAW